MYEDQLLVKYCSAFFLILSLLEGGCIKLKFLFLNYAFSSLNNSGSHFAGYWNL